MEVLHHMNITGDCCDCLSCELLMSTVKIHNKISEKSCDINKKYEFIVHMQAKTGAIQAPSGLTG